MSVNRSRAAVERQRAEKVESFQQAAYSEATRKSYARALQHFTAWGASVPSTPEELASYLAEHARSLAVATLQQRLVAIHRAHLEMGLPSPAMDPAVKRTMQGIRRTLGVAQRRVKALVKDELLEVLAFVDKQKPMKAARDRALLLVGFAGAFRRSELVGLRVEDLTSFDHGVEILLRRSKTDQMGKGRTVFIPKATGRRCPVAALLQWVSILGVLQGPLFPQVDRHDRVGRVSLSPQSVALIVKQAVRSAKGCEAAAHFSGHSMRAGYVTTAAEMGLQPYLIREVTGHRSDVTLAKYIRPIQKRKVPSLL